MAELGAVLVTGARGFVGRHVVDELVRRGIPVIERPHRWSSIDEVAAAIAGRSLRACVHLGWYAAPGDYLVNIEENALSLWRTTELAGLLDGAACPHLVVAGSSAEYGAVAATVDEDEPCLPTTPYGAAKALCRSLLVGGPARPATTGVAWARLFNVVGPGEHPGRIVPRAARAGLTGEELGLSAGTQVRDYVDVRDAAAALVHLALGAVPGTFNVSTGEGTPLRELLHAVASEAGHPDALRFGVVDPAAGESTCLVGDNGRLVATGWRPERDRSAIVAGVVEWWRRQGAVPPG